MKDMMKVRELMAGVARKSSYSSPSQDCVALLRAHELVGIQDTKEHPDSSQRSTLVVGDAAWRALRARITS